MQLKVSHLICLLFFIVTIHSCQNEGNTAALKITDPIELDKVLNHFVEEDFYPFVYARLEDLEGNVIYEHSSKKKPLKIFMLLTPKQIVLMDTMGITFGSAVIP